MEGYEIGRRNEERGYGEVAVDNSRGYDAGRRRGFKRFGRGLIYLTSLASLVALNINPSTAFHAKEAREITIGEDHGIDPDTSRGKGKEGREVERGGGGGCVIITAEVVDPRDNGDDGPSGESSGSSGGNSGGSSGGSSGGDSGGGGPSGPGGQ